MPQFPQMNALLYGRTHSNPQQPRDQLSPVRAAEFNSSVTTQLVQQTVCSEVVIKEHILDDRLMVGARAK